MVNKRYIPQKRGIYHALCIPLYISSISALIYSYIFCLYMASVKSYIYHFFPSVLCLFTLAICKQKSPPHLFTDVKEAFLIKISKSIDKKSKVCYNGRVKATHKTLLQKGRKWNTTKTKSVMF